MRDERYCTTCQRFVDVSGMPVVSEMLGRNAYSTVKDGQVVHTVLSPRRSAAKKQKLGVKLAAHAAEEQ